MKYLVPIIYHISMVNFAVAAHCLDQVKEVSEEFGGIKIAVWIFFGYNQRRVSSIRTEIRQSYLVLVLVEGMM